MNTEIALTNTAGIVSVIALWLYVISGISRHFRNRLQQVGFAGLAVSLAAVTGVIVLRTLESGRFPCANLYESLLLFVWSVLATFIVASDAYKLRHLGWLPAFVSSCILLLASWLPPAQHQIAPLAPALVSYWRFIHVPPVIAAYGLFLLAGLFAVVYLWEAGRRLTALGCVLAIIVSIVSAGLGILSRAPAMWVQIFYWGGSAIAIIATVVVLKREMSLPQPEAPNTVLLDEASQRCIVIAFPLLTFGIITGALWANHAWGTYWSWDPKESMSLVTWLTYAIYLHQRTRPTARDDVMSVLAVIGLLLSLLTYLGFNFLGFGGLHAYGKIG